MKDSLKWFGFFSLFLSLFFLGVVSQTGIKEPTYVFFVGFYYSFFLIFHKRLERWAEKVKHPLHVYAFLVFLGGMIIEVMAYGQGLWRTAHGLNPYVFCPESFSCDVIFFGVPYYVFLAVGFVWLLKRYDFSIKQFGFALWFFWAVSVDQFSHTVFLFVGGIAGILGFIIAGLLLLFSFHGPYVIFDKRLRELYPGRKKDKKKYILVLLVQVLTFPLVLLLIGLKNIFF